MEEKENNVIINGRIIQNMNMSETMRFPDPGMFSLVSENNDKRTH